MCCFAANCVQRSNPRCLSCQSILCEDMDCSISQTSLFALESIAEGLLSQMTNPRLAIWSFLARAGAIVLLFVSSNTCGGNVFHDIRRRKFVEATKILCRTDGTANFEVSIIACILRNLRCWACRSQASAGWHTGCLGTIALSHFVGHGERSALASQLLLLRYQSA